MLIYYDLPEGNWRVHLPGLRISGSPADACIGIHRFVDLRFDASARFKDGEKAMDGLIALGRFRDDATGDIIPGLDSRLKRIHIPYTGW